jgi:hypothetical protein
VKHEFRLRQNLAMVVRHSGALALRVYRLTQVVSFQATHRTGQFGQIQSMELEEAREAYEVGGPAKLRAFIDRLHRYIPGDHYLTDANGRDILTGEDRSAMLASAEPEGRPSAADARTDDPDGEIPRWIVSLDCRNEAAAHRVAKLPPVLCADLRRRGLGVLAAGSEHRLRPCARWREPSTDSARAI